MALLPVVNAWISLVLSSFDPSCWAGAVSFVPVELGSFGGARTKNCLQGIYTQHALTG